LAFGQKATHVCPVQIENKYLRFVVKVMFFCIFIFLMMIQIPAVMLVGKKVKVDEEYDFKNFAASELE